MARKISLRNDDLNQFADILLRSLFREDGPLTIDAEEVERVFNTLKTLCLLRGVSSLLNAMKETDDSTEVIGMWGRASQEFMQNVAEATLKIFDEPNFVPSPSERQLHDFFESRGILDELRYNTSILRGLIPKTVKREKVLDDIDAAAAHLRDLGERMGIPPEVFEMIEKDIEERGHRRDYGPGAPTDNKYHGISLGYWVICPDHGRQLLSNDVYTEQLLDPDRGFRCPVCDERAELANEVDEDV